MAVLWSLADKIKLQNKMKQQQPVVKPMVWEATAPMKVETFAPLKLDTAPKPINPATVPTFDIGNTVRNKPTVATPANPVISKGGSTFVPNTSDINSMDKNQLQDYIDTYTVKSKFGTIKEEDAIKAVKAQRLLNDFIKQEQSTIGSPIDAEIAKAQADREALAKQLETQNLTARQAKERQLTSSFEAQKAEQLAAGERQKQASQAALSTSWFGRSTFNADQQTRIQQQTDSAIQTLSAAKEAELARFDAEQAGASAEYLGILDKQISDLKTSAYTAQQKAIAEASKINQETGASMEESIQNLIATAKWSWLEIDAGDEWAIKMLAQVAIKDWKINQSVLDALPDWIRAIVKAAAETWYGKSIWEPGKTISIWSGRSERVLQWNPETWRYDIPVGWGSVGGGVWWVWGVGWWAWWTADSTQLELISRLQRVQDAVSNSNLPRSSIMLDPNIQADLNYLKANMTFEKLNEMKARWVKLWVLSDSDMKLLWQAALTITPGMTKERVISETNRLMQWLWGNVSASTTNTTKTTPAPTTKVNTKSTKLEDLWNSL